MRVLLRVLVSGTIIGGRIEARGSAGSAFDFIDDGASISNGR
jgi:hypothetical protein